MNWYRVAAAVFVSAAACSDDSITGVMPPEIGEMESLTELFLHHDSLTGTIPSAIANLTNLPQVVHGGDTSGESELPEALRDFRMRGCRRRATGVSASSACRLSP